MTVTDDARISSIIMDQAENLPTAATRIGMRVLQATNNSSGSDGNGEESSNSPQHDTFGDFIVTKSSVLVIAILFFLSLVVLCVFVARSICLARYQRDIFHWCCAFPTNSNNARPVMSPEQRQQLERDAALALELQTHLTEQEREVLLKEQRRKRRAWYEKFLAPYVMTVQDADLVECRADPADIENGFTDGEHHVQYLCLPVDDRNLRCPSTSCRRQVEAECTICLVEYERGDQVVWSSLPNCRHVFHYDCLMTWLVRGKKRCPCCREWYVPAKRISEQQKAWREREQGLRQQHSSEREQLEEGSNQEESPPTTDDEGDNASTTSTASSSRPASSRRPSVASSNDAATAGLAASADEQA